MRFTKDISKLGIQAHFHIVGQIHEANLKVLEALISSLPYYRIEVLSVRLLVNHLKVIR
jgi:hypothetical protein